MLIPRLQLKEDNAVFSRNVTIRSEILRVMLKLGIRIFYFLQVQLTLKKGAAAFFFQ